MASENKRTVRLCALEEVPADAPLRICVAGSEAIAVVKIDGELYAFADECTHGSGSLSEGFVDDDVIVCPVHAGEFHIPTGRALDLPVTEDLRTYEIWAEGSDVLADLSEPANPSEAL